MDKKIEYWDLYNLNGTYAMTIKRGTVFSPRKYYHNVTEIITTDGRGHILITRRSLQKQKEAGAYEFPAGSVWAGETVEEAARRELYEETGIKCESMQLIATTKAAGIHRHFFMAFVPDLLKKEIILQEGETMGYRICTLNEWLEIIGQGRYVEKRLQMYSPEVFQKIEDNIGKIRGRPKKPHKVKLSNRGTDPLRGTVNGTSGKKDHTFSYPDDIENVEEYI